MGREPNAMAESQKPPDEIEKNAIEKKLAVIRAAAKYKFPAGDIEQMLAEIEQGYLSGEWPRE